MIRSSRLLTSGEDAALLERFLIDLPDRFDSDFGPVLVREEEPNASWRSPERSSPRPITFCSWALTLGLLLSFLVIFRRILWLDVLGQ